MIPPHGLKCNMIKFLLSCSVGVGSSAQEKEKGNSLCYLLEVCALSSKYAVMSSLMQPMMTNCPGAMINMMIKKCFC